MKQPNIKTSKKVVPMIYAYTTPGVTYHEGWTKIGYTENDVETRIKQQTHTADIDITLNGWEMPFLRMEVAIVLQTKIFMCI